jgi:hypothetical protein
VRHLWVLLWVPLLACSSSVPPQAPDRASTELIPAEWTVSEDTSSTGEVTTASVQLPAARDISGLVDDQAPRLILQCVDGKVQASIDLEGSAETTSEPDTGREQGQRVAIQLDSAPSCE